MAKQDYTIIASQNVKVPGQMDLIPGALDKWSNSLVIVIIKFYLVCILKHS